MRIFNIGLAQNRPGSVVSPCHTKVLSLSKHLAGTILRKSYNRLMVWCVLSVAISAQASASNADGQIPMLSKPAQRVISLSPHITELLFAAGGGDRIVGVSAYSDYPEAAKQIPVVGDSYQLDLERIITLKPDLLVVWQKNGSVRNIERLQKLGIPVFFSDENKLTDIPDNIQMLGQLMGTQIEADKVANDLRSQIDALEKKYARLSPVRLFYQVWNQPLLTLNGKHIVNDAIQTCGGVNIFAQLSMTAPTVDLESVLRKNPEAVIGAGAPATDSPQHSELAMWKQYPGVAAVKYDNLYVIDGNLMNRAGPRMIAGVAALCETLNKVRKNRSKY